MKRNNRKDRLTYEQDHIAREITIPEVWPGEHAATSERYLHTKDGTIDSVDVCSRCDAVEPLMFCSKSEEDPRINEVVEIARRYHAGCGGEWMPVCVDEWIARVFRKRRGR
jgi:hypothetical protein